MDLHNRKLKNHHSPRIQGINFPKRYINIEYIITITYIRNT